MFINLTEPEYVVSRVNILQIVTYRENGEGVGSYIITTHRQFVVNESPKQIDAMIDYLTLTSNERRYR